MKLIDKSVLIAEIERKINEIDLDRIEDWRYRFLIERDIKVMKNILSLINTLEVKEMDEIPARIEVNKYHNRYISSWAGLCQYDNFRIGEEIKILLPKKENNYE